MSFRQLELHSFEGPVPLHRYSSTGRPLDMAADVNLRARTAEKQRKWRQETAPPAITVHLDARDLATLDAIAIQLYYERPHDPANELVEQRVFPGRSQAIRELCAQWRALNRSDPEQVLGKLQGKLSQFYVREASWRRARGSPLLKRPKPPWRGGTAILERLLRRGIF